MMKRLLALMVMAMLCCTTAFAEDRGQTKKESSVSDWIKNMQKKISSVVPKKSLSVTTGVAGVRGAKEDTQVKLYWKGRKGEEAVSEQELKEFKEGLDFAAKGDKDGAIKELDDFLKQYPDSALIPDAKKTLDLVKSEE